MIDSPFNSDLFLGYVSHVAPQFVKVHYPSSRLLKKFTLEGEKLNSGLVGEFVVIEDEDYGFLGKINEVYIEDRNRSDLSESSFKNDNFEPLGKIELLLAFDHYNPLKTKKGLSVFPQIGSKVYVSSPSFVKNYVEKFGIKDTDTKDIPTIEIGGLISSPQTKVNASQQALFGRHCAIVGTTGGGKSWTLSRLIGGAKNNNTKVILIDATGEYHDYSNQVINIKLGEGGKYFHYKKLTVDDLFYLLKPSEKTQSPKLLEAIRSLKMVRISNGNDIKSDDGDVVPVEDGILHKSNNPIRPYQEFYYKHVTKIEDNNLDLDITKLARQVTQECIFPTERHDSTKFGGRADNDISNCVPLISRINEIINRSEFNKVFGFQDQKGKNCITNNLNDFFEAKEGSVIRIDFSEVKFEFQSREILANAIANYLLLEARNNGFKESVNLTLSRLVT